MAKPAILRQLGKFKYLILALFLFLFLWQLPSSPLNKDSALPTNNQPPASAPIPLDALSPALIYRPIYNDITGSGAYKSMEAFAAKPLQERCEFYFRRLLQLQPNWEMSEHLGANIGHDEIRKSQDIVHFNIYNHCYNVNEFTPPEGLDEKMFPYLTGLEPVYQHWSGVYTRTTPSNELPVQEITTKLYSEHSPRRPEKISKLPFWRNHLRKVDGSGIVVSVYDGNVNEVVLLLKNLRTLQSELKVELVHRGDLLDSNKAMISRAARITNEEETGPLEVWFVDISQCLKKPLSDVFDGYFNKLLAYAFTSFKHVVLMDSDVVHFTPPEKLLLNPKYVASGTLFFKDRNLPYRMSEAFTTFMKETSPNLVDSYLFDIPTVPTRIWDNEYFQNRYFHYMEAGVVCVDKSRHLPGVLMSLQLPRIKSTRIGSYGDKEHFWMGLLLAGDVKFEFEGSWTATVGAIQSEDNAGGDIVNEGFLSGRRIYSSHPAHISSDGSLLWINSGIKNCPKKVDIGADLRKIRSDFSDIGQFMNHQDLQKWYDNAMTFEAYIIPPDSKYNSIADDSENLRVVKEGGISKMGAVRTPLCDKYIWCAYECVDGGACGTYGEFSKEQTEWYTYVAKSYLGV